MADYRKGALNRNSSVSPRLALDKIRNQVEVTEDVIRYLKVKSSIDPELFKEEAKTQRVFNQSEEKDINIDLDE